MPYGYQVQRPVALDHLSLGKLTAIRTKKERDKAIAGTPEGGRKAAVTNRQRYGLNFYELIGRKGGKISRGGGFATNHELAVSAGIKGGKASRRKKAVVDEGPEIPEPTVYSSFGFEMFECPNCTLRASSRGRYEKHYRENHL